MTIGSESPSAAADTSRFLDPALDRLSISPSEPVPRDDLERWYRAMRLARTFE